MKFGLFLLILHLQLCQTIKKLTALRSEQRAAVRHQHVYVKRIVTGVRPQSAERPHRSHLQTKTEESHEKM